MCKFSISSTGIKKGDIIICPDGSGFYYIGEVTSDYYFVQGETLPHRRSVKWLNINLNPYKKNEKNGLLKN